MNVRYGLKLGLFSLAVVALCAPSASASIIGHLSVGNCAGGGVTVSFSVIDWSPAVAPGSPVACLQSGIGTALSQHHHWPSCLPLSSARSTIYRLPGVSSGS